jgi:uncharacterized protein YkwD
MLKRLVVYWIVIVTVVGGVGAGMTAGEIDIKAPDVQDQTESEPTPTRSLNTTLVEELVAAEVNDARTANGLSALESDAELAGVAQSHSNDMAEYGFLSHNGSDGRSMSERYDDAGYGCRIPISGDRYANGGENVAMSYYRTELVKGTYHSTEGELARGIVNGWLESPPHRANLLADHWTVQGIGVAETYDNQVYVTQNFC